MDQELRQVSELYQDQNIDSRVLTEEGRVIADNIFNKLKCHQIYCASCRFRNMITRAPGGNNECPLFGFDAHNNDKTSLVFAFVGSVPTPATRVEVLDGTML